MLNEADQNKFKLLVEEWDSLQVRLKQIKQEIRNLSLTMRLCSRCEQVLDPSMFHTRLSMNGNKHLRSWCKACHRSYNAAKQKEYRLKNKTEWRPKWLKQ